MFYLCSVSSKDLMRLSGFSGDPSKEDGPKLYNQLILIGQKPDCSGYLILSDEILEEYTLHYAVPSGYDFIFRQSWGLTINEDIIHRTIATLRAEEYPPMSDYLDAKVKNDLQQEESYLAACAAVKAKYPKFSFTY